MQLFSDWAQALKMEAAQIRDRELFEEGSGRLIKYYLRHHPDRDHVLTVETSGKIAGVPVGSWEISIKPAKAIEACKAETGTGSVHESAVGNADLPESEPDTPRPEAGEGVE